MQSHKCPKCNLVNFANSETCKRCDASLLENEVINEPANSKTPDNFQSTLAESNTLNLEPCPDCLHLCSRMAETCPNCGRYLRQLKTNKNSFLPKVIVGSVLLVVCVLAYTFFFQAKRDVEVNAAVVSGNPAKAGVTNKNRESAKAALNAIGEIDSVTSVGTNYSQYTSTIQSAKIKYDVAMRDYNPQDAAEAQIQQQLEETIVCYVDASDAWSEFLKEGESFVEKGNSKMSRLSSEYGFSATSEYGYYRGEVINAIWEKAAKKFNNLKNIIK